MRVCEGGERKEKEETGGGEEKRGEGRERERRGGEERGGEGRRGERSGEGRGAVHLNLGSIIT